MQPHRNRELAQVLDGLAEGEEQLAALEKSLALDPRCEDAHDLKAELLRHKSDNVLFPGALYGPDYRTLQRNALVYIQATEVGGTHPALIEAMGSGGAVLALDTPENREVGGDAVGYFGLHPDSLSGILCEWLADAGLREALRERARRRAAAEYGWDAVTDAYEQLFRKIS